MAGIIRIGAEAQVNGVSTDVPFGNAPAMIRMTNGNFMVIWSESSTTGDGSGGSVKAQVMTPGGVRVGGEFVVNTTTTGTQAIARAGVMSDGTIFVAWQDGSATGGDTSGNAIRGQLLGATGAKVGTEFLINTTTAGSQAAPAVSALGNGNVLVAWNDASQTGADTSGSAIRAQVMTTAGVKIGGEFVVNTHTAGAQTGPKLATLTSGNVIVTWTDAAGATGDTDGNSIRAQILDAAGNRVGGEFQVNTNGAGSQTGADVVALANGNFVVTWQDSSGTLGDASGSSIKAQVFDSSGQAVGAEILVNTLVSGAQLTPAIARLDSGDFVITWSDLEVPGTPARQDLRGQLFAPDGTRVGAEFVAVTPVSNLVQGAPGIVALADNTFAIASASALVDGNGMQTTRGERVQLFAGSRELFGTAGADQLVGARGADLFHASQGHDTFDGRGGIDRIIVDGDNHNIFPVTGGTVTYTLAGNVLTNSVGTLDATLVSVEQVSIVDTSAASHTFDDTGQAAFATSTVFLTFGNGNDRVLGGGNINADLGLGNDVVQGRTSAMAGGTSDFLTLMTHSGVSLVTVNDVGPSSGDGAGIAVGYSTVAGNSLTTITDFESVTVQAAAGLGLRIDASNSLSNVGLVDSPYDDLLIGGRGNNLFISFGSTGGDTDLSGGVDYKYGGGGADTFDYTIAMPQTMTDHLMDVDSNDVLDFSYFAGTALFNGPNPVFIGTGAFTGVQRQIRYDKIDGTTHIYTDLDGNGVADGMVTIENGAFDLALYDNGSGGENVLRITLAQNFVDGTSAGESLTTGTMGADVIRAYQGDDTIKVTSGQDFIDGGSGRDTLTIAIGDTTAFTAPTGARTYTISANRLFDSSGALNTSFLGIEAITFATVGAGNFGDTIDASLFGGAINVTLGDGNNLVFGTAQADIITGGSGADSLTGNGGADTLIGGAGDDIYTISDSSTVIVEAVGGGNDTIKSTVSYVLGAGVEVESLRLLGTANLNLTGNADNQTLAGNIGNNVLDSGGGGGRMKGQAGDDTYIVRSTTDIVVELAGDGDDTVKAALSYVLGAAAQAEHLTTIDAAATTAIDLTGNDYSHDIQGNAGVNVLTGGSGNDALAGNGGADTLIGGAGDDIYTISDSATLVVETVGNGNDTIKALVSYVLGAGVDVETARLIGTANLDLTGNADHQILIGNAGNNVLDGGGGGDRLKGAGGDDIFIVRSAADVIVEVVGDGDDTAKAALSYTLGAAAQVEHLTTIDATGTTAINLTGNDYSHDLRGNAGANVLTGGSGDDVLRGFAGNDTLVGGSGADRFVFDHGTGQDSVGDFVSGSDKLDLTAFGFASFSAVQVATQDVGGNAVIDLGGGDSVTLTGFLSAQLQSGDVILSGGGGQAPLKSGFAGVQGWIMTEDTGDTWHKFAGAHVLHHVGPVSLPAFDYLL